MIYWQEMLLITGLCFLSNAGLQRLMARHVTVDSSRPCGHVTGLTWAQDPLNVSVTFLCLDGNVVSALSCSHNPVLLLAQLRKCLRQQISTNVSSRFTSARLWDILRSLEYDKTSTAAAREWSLTDQMNRQISKAYRLNYSLVGRNTDSQKSIKHKFNVQKFLSKLSPLEKLATIKENSAMQSVQNTTVASLAASINLEENRRSPSEVSALRSGRPQFGDKEMEHPTQLSFLDKGVDMRTLTDQQVFSKHHVTDVENTSQAALVALIKEYFPGHLCAKATVPTVLVHPTYCHWFYDCSLPPADAKWSAGVEPLTSECPYPLLFSEVSLTCLAYNEVDCGQRTVYKAPCDYRENTCTLPTCHRCQTLFADCAGLPDGFHPFPGREWTPWFIYCRDERTMLQDRCEAGDQIFSPASKQCASIDRVPAFHGGNKNECRGRSDGYHPDDSGICHMFIECMSEHLLGIAACPDDITFDPITRQCNRSAVVPPCGPLTSLEVSDIFCAGQQDGFYADLYGRCSLYFDCKRHRLRAFLKCPVGSFNPIKQSCDAGPDVYAPCGLRPNPCKEKSDGLYTDMMSNCLSIVTCRNGYVSRVEPCPDGQVFDSFTSKCILPELAAPPCGIAPTCSGKLDGKYRNEAKGCAHYFRCLNGSHVGFGQCDVVDGGFFFNPVSRECDFPQNICPPCGHSNEQSC